MIMLNPVQTKFGAISIETLIYPRSEEERIKIYDSDDCYLDYIPLQTLIDSACAMETTIEEEYATRLKSIRKANSIEELVQLLTTDCESITKNKSTIVCGDYINRIGEYYLIMEE